MTTKESVSSLTVEDVTGQKSVRVKSVPSEAQIDQVVKQLLGDLSLPTSDPSGRQISYQARLAREERRLGSQERVGDVLQDNDTLRLMPDVTAG